MTRTIPNGWISFLEAFTLALRAAGKPQTTISTRLNHLRRLARTCGHHSPWTLTGDQLVAWCGRQDWSSETRRSYRGTLRAFWSWGVETGQVAENAAAALPKVPASRPRPRPAPERVYAEALAVARPRERLMLRLAAECGLRRAEVSRIHAEDILEDLDGWSLRVHGKGGRERIVPMPASLAVEVRRGAAGHTPGHGAAGWLFPGDDGGHLSPRWVGKLVTQLLPGAHTMHALRHRFATRAYLVDRDTFTVQELLGHASPDTTRRYVYVPRESLRRTVDAVAA
ncbi:tyrosine-type recombinase/integrase [Rhodococcus tibetensis]|uniref:Tyrosine-type recombinase/integrase n=1 Tax=Rhodococcus tibetensis TaxID=2965064 RepID=A0ABT1QH25_9NOCA|nr:tyrosine-type recombinase/integrase [Rhodococcus sp. FXJ9.536]MCQ4120400.1 tyrosine-type recombinase/integrase [Rhodococcus sp. FXJ9.536]